MWLWWSRRDETIQSASIIFRYKDYDDANKPWYYHPISVSSFLLVTYKINCSLSRPSYRTSEINAYVVQFEMLQEKTNINIKSYCNLVLGFLFRKRCSNFCMNYYWKQWLDENDCRRHVKLIILKYLGEICNVIIRHTNLNWNMCFI